MDFTGSGKISFRGCADYSKSDYYYIPFGEGSEVFVRAKAQIGILEKVVIKRFNIVKSSRTFGKAVVQYFDTMNRIWFVNDLCDEETAIALAETYYENKINDISRAVCPIRPSIEGKCPS